MDEIEMRKADRFIPLEVFYETFFLPTSYRQYLNIRGSALIEPF